MPKREEKIGMIIADKAYNHLPDKAQKVLEEKSSKIENTKEKVFLIKNNLFYFFNFMKIAILNKKQ